MSLLSEFHVEFNKTEVMIRRASVSDGNVCPPSPMVQHWLKLSQKRALPDEMSTQIAIWGSLTGGGGTQ